MALTDSAIRNAKPKEKSYKLFDGSGLYLEISPSGGKWWRWKYRFAKKENRLSLGVYPLISLKEAREKRDENRKLLGNGIDPSKHRQITKTLAAERLANNFEAIAREWCTKHSNRWTPHHVAIILRRLEQNIFPWLGCYPISEITASALLRVLRRIEERGALDTAHRVKQVCSQIFRYAIATGRADRDPALDLKGALPPAKTRHYSSLIDPKQVAELLRVIEGYHGSLVTKCALKLAPLVFVRPGELRQAEWNEFDLQRAEWRIPAIKMKAREVHIVPLSRQAIAILEEIYPLTGSSRYVFPGERTDTRPMSNNAINAALRRMGYAQGEMTGHGFRSMASTILHEQGWESDVIERQLAHAERNTVKAAYNRAEHLPKRKMMMQTWADYLDELKNTKTSSLRLVG